MKLIPLTRGQFAMVDDADYQFLMQWKWYAAKRPNGQWYAVRKAPMTNYVKGRDGRKLIYMHALLCACSSDRPIPDHKDWNGLNNQRDNLRPVTHSQNSQARHRGSGISRYKGVSWSKRYLKWTATIYTNGKNVRIGLFKDECDAATAYNFAAEAAFGDFAVGNLPAK